jgi:hypothetical protein
MVAYKVARQQEGRPGNSNIRDLQKPLGFGNLSPGFGNQSPGLGDVGPNRFDGKPRLLHDPPRFLNLPTSVFSHGALASWFGWLLMMGQSPVHLRQFRFQKDDQIRDRLPMRRVPHECQEVAAPVEVVKQFGTLVQGHVS